jgi:radical SAM-linked protein
VKYLITFEKGEQARWLGHLDILRAFERAVRRADLPIAFSAGFNPREKIAFASALAVGVTGEAEPAVIELNGALSPGELVRRLNDRLPPGIQLRTAREIPDAGSRDLLNSFDRAEVRVLCVCAPGTAPAAAQGAVQNLLAQPELPIERAREGQVKKVDVRPYLHALAITGLEKDRLTFTMILAIGQEGSVRPAEIGALLAEALPGLTVRRIHRVRLFAGADG